MKKKLLCLLTLLAVTQSSLTSMTLQQMQAKYDHYKAFALDQDATEQDIQVDELLIIEIALSIAAFEKELAREKPHEARRVHLEFVDDAGESLSDAEIQEQMDYLQGFIMQLAEKWGYTSSPESPLA